VIDRRRTHWKPDLTAGFYKFNPILILICLGSLSSILFYNTKGKSSDQNEIYLKLSELQCKIIYNESLIKTHAFRVNITMILSQISNEILNGWSTE